MAAIKVRSVIYTLLAWSTIYGCNLIVPLAWGLYVTRDDSSLGMFLAIVLLWGVGLFVCIRSPFSRNSLFLGGILTSVSQIVPLLQMLAGMMALQFCHSASYNWFAGSAGTNVEAFTLTILTGLQLLLVAIVFGGVIVAIYQDVREANKSTT